MKTKKLVATVLSLLLTLLLAVGLTACPNVQEGNITLTLAGDKNVTINSASLIVAKGTTWQAMKDKANEAVTFATSYELKEWLFDDKSGKSVTDDTVFTENKTLFAVSQKQQVILTLTGDDKVIINQQTIVADAGSKWSDIKAKAELAIDFASGSVVKAWRLDNLSGELLSEETVFTENKTLFVESKEVVTLSFLGDTNVIINTPSLVVDKGVTWDIICDQVNLFLSFTEYYELKGWHFDDLVGELILDTTPFTENKTLFAETQRQQITLNLKGDGNTFLNPSTLSVDKGVSWGEVKAQAEASLSFTMSGYALKAWHFDEVTGAILNDDTIFTESKTLFAETHEVIELMLNAIDGSTTFTNSKLAVARGSLWSDIKVVLTDMVNLPNESIELTGWKLTSGDSDPFISDSHSFVALTAIYAITQATSFSINGNGAINGYNDSPTSIIIPAKIGSKKVLAIDNEAFKEKSTLVSVDFSTVTHLISIGGVAFYKCRNLTGTLKFPASLEEIKDGYKVGFSLGGAFMYCDKLMGVDFSLCRKLRKIGKLAFNFTPLGGDLNLLNCESLVLIGERAFAGAKFTGTLRFPDSLTTFEKSVFLNNDFSAVTLNFSNCKKLKVIGELCFYNTKLTSIDLSACRELDEIVMRAFELNTDLEIKLPVSVTKIGSKAFGEETSLGGLCKKVLIPNSPESDSKRIRTLLVNSLFPESRIEVY